MPDPRFLLPKVLFEDTHLAVFDKPSGLLSQGDASGEPSLVDFCRTHFGRNYVGLIHRLDRNTSGIIVVAKRSKSANRLTESLQEGSMVRTYLAWLIGDVKKAETWEHRLVKDPKTNVVAVAKSAKEGKAAKLTVRPISKLIPDSVNAPCLTLCEFVLDTGRSHQIRVQSQASGYPLLGDTKYGGKNPVSFPRMALHSHRVRFPHPMSEEVLSFECPLPDELNLTGKSSPSST